MAKKKTAEKPQEESGEVYYVVNIYDNHGTINITQSGAPPQPPPKPPGS